MTAPYRLRSVKDDRKAAYGFIGVVGAAVALGLFPAVTKNWSVAFSLLYIAVLTGLLLANMHTVDRRLREVTG